MSTIDQEITRRYESDPLFESAHGALVFAFNYAPDFYDRPLMNKMADPPHRSGKGLVGLDGAAQAGFILAELRSLGTIPEAVLTARTAPKTMPCTCRRLCCSGKSTTPVYTEAIRTLTQAALDPLSGCVSHYRLRSVIVQRFFGESKSLGEIAELCGVNRDTASDHSAKVTKYLKTIEASAWARFDGRLSEIGIVRCAENA